MKKYIISLLAVAALVGCTTFEDEKSLAVVNAPDPAISLGKVEDTAFTATVSAQAGTGFYSYAVCKGGAGTVNAETLLKVKISSAIAAATTDYAKNPSVTFTVDNLDRNATYTIYAVAASEQGTIGEVISQEVTTSDAQNPAAASWTYTDNVGKLTFSEPVTFVEGSEVTATYYAINTKNGTSYEILATETVDVEVSVSGNVATFTLGEIPDGAYYAVSYGAGAFVDAVGNPVAALSSSYSIDDKGKAVPAGATGRQSTKNFDLSIYGDEEGTGVTAITDLASPIWIDVPEDFVYYKYSNATNGGGKGWSIVYESATSTRTYTQAWAYAYGWNNSYNCALAYPNIEDYSGIPDPERGEYVTITIPEGFLTDIYGNTSNEFVIGPAIYSYGYTLEDLYGTYKLVASTRYCGSYEQEGIIIAPAPTDDEDYEDMDVIIHNLFRDTPCCDDLDSFTNLNTSFGATFNGDTGSLDFGWYDAIGIGSSDDWNNYVLILSFDNDDNTFGFQMPEAGTLVLSNNTYVYLNQRGWWDYYLAEETKLVKVSDEYAVESASSVPVRTAHDTQIVKKALR